jgi:two-component sensor histidine kinase
MVSSGWPRLISHSSSMPVGPFVTFLNVDLVTSLQGLILVVAISTFILAFSVEDFLRISSELEHVNKSLDRIVSDRTEQLRGSVEHNKVLLGELKHRIKNNLQVITSLIGFHTRSVADERAHERLVILRSQIAAMAVTYDLLHQTDSAETVDFSKIVPTLCRSIADAYGELVSLSTETSGETPMKSDTAVSISLAVNELITNSIKHASKPVTVSVACRPVDDQILISITDDGPGFPPGFDIRQAGGFGMRMVQGLITQVNGDWRLLPQELGSTVEIRVPLLFGRGP